MSKGTGQLIESNAARQSEAFLLSFSWILYYHVGFYCQLTAFRS